MEVAEQRLRWLVSVTQPMLLCSQVQRSGGTLLARLFDGCPGCFAHPSELHWGRPKKWHWPKLDWSSASTPDEVFGRLEEGWPQLFAAEGYHKYSNWMHREHPERIRRYPFVFDLDLQRRIFLEVLARRTGQSQRDLLNAYLTSLFNAWLDYQNLYSVPKRWVTAFLPKLIMESDGVDRFFADYPDGLLVTIVRDPGGWLSSFSRHVAMEDTNTALRLWAQSVDASLRAQAARPDRVIVLLFDDLVHKTEQVMRLLCNRMGLSFSEVLLEPTYNSMPVLSDSSHVLATGIDETVTERYRDTLTTEQLKSVARMAIPHFEKVQSRFALECDTGT